MEKINDVFDMYMDGSGVVIRLRGKKFRSTFGMIDYNIRGLTITYARDIFRYNYLGKEIFRLKDSAISGREAQLSFMPIKRALVDVLDLEVEILKDMLMILGHEKGYTLKIYRKEKIVGYPFYSSCGRDENINAIVVIPEENKMIMYINGEKRVSEIKKRYVLKFLRRNVKLERYPFRIDRLIRSIWDW